MPRSLLISISSISQLRMFETLCKRIRKRYSNIVFAGFDCNQEQIDAIKLSAKTLGVQFDFHETYHENISEKEITSNLSFRLSLLKMVIHLPKGKQQLKKIHSLTYYRHYYQYIFKKSLAKTKLLIRKHNPEVILVPEDGVSGNCYLIQEAKKNCIPVIDVPYETSGKEDFMNALKEKIINQEAIYFNPNASPHNKFIQNKARQWVMKTKFGELLLFPPELIVARIKVGLNLPNPWTTHGGNANLIAAESQVMLDHYQNEGLRKTKLKIIGSPYCDVLYDSLKSDPVYEQAYMKKTKINPNKTSVLITIPPSYHETRTNTNEFSSYKDMVRQLCSMIQGKNISTSVSIHPAVSAEQRELIQFFNFNITHDDIIEEIPKHDIFLVLSFSSTIRWALACGKPVINYDAYAHELSFYNNTPGFYNFRSLSDVERQLTTLIQDTEYEAVAKLIGEIRQDWGILDGQNTARLCEAIDEQP